MTTGAEKTVAEIWADWQDTVNMTANQLEDFLDTEQSKSVGDKGSGGESTGHQSGRRIVKILRTLSRPRPAMRPGKCPIFESPRKLT